MPNFQIRFFDQTREKREGERDQLPFYFIAEPSSPPLNHWEVTIAVLRSNEREKSKVPNNSFTGGERDWLEQQGWESGLKFPLSSLS